jgi:hypothetical protein
MAKAQDPPSPVDAYGTPPPPVPAGEETPQPFTTVPPYSAAPGSVPSSAQYYSPPRATNTLAIIALVASCAGILIPLADIAGIVMGFIALSQIKRTGENGRGLALGAVIAGFAILVIQLVLIALYVIFIIWVVGVAGSAANYSGDY